MRLRMSFVIAALASLPAFVAGPGYGQSQPAPATEQPAAASAPPPQTQPAPVANAKPAKVWTNDAIKTLRNDGGVSVVGKQPPQKATAPPNPSKRYALDKDPAWYRMQLRPLQAEIKRLDGQIEKTKAFLSGQIVNEPPASFDAYLGIPGNPQDQLKQMEANRQRDQAKIDDLLDRARHNGVEPGALP